MINEQYTRHYSNGVEDLRHYNSNLVKSDVSATYLVVGV